MNVNQAAFATSITFSAATIGCTIAMAKAATTATVVAFGALALLAAIVSVAAISAWVGAKGHPDQSASHYFEVLKEHLPFVAVGCCQYVGQAAFQGAVQGLAQGVGARVSDRISGRNQDRAYRA